MTTPSTGPIPNDSDMALRGAPIAVLDFETTGVDPTECWPVSVAVVHCNLGDTDPELVMNRRIKPPVPIPEDASKIHGIYDADVADAPSYDEVLDELEDRLEQRLLVAYNLTYDWTILDRLLAAQEMPRIPFGTIDPYVFMRAIDKYQKGKKLSDVAKRRKVQFDAHDAAADAMATARLLPLMLRELARGVRRHKWGKWQTEGPWCDPRHVQSIAGIWEWTQKAAMAQELDFHAYCKKQGKELPDLRWHKMLGVKP